MVKKETKIIAKVGMLSAIAIILQYIGTLTGLKVGGFLDVEISDFPAVLAALSMGPVAGLMTELIKNLIHLLITTTGGVGELANFLVNGVFAFAVGLVYQRNKTKKGAYISLICGVIALTVFAAIATLYILLPLYMSGASFADKLKIVLTIITPFNFVRGITLSLLTLLCYKGLSPILHK